MRHENQLRQKQHPHQHYLAKTIDQHSDERENAGRCETVQILWIHATQGWDIINGSKDQTIASTLSHEKVAVLWKTKAVSIPTKIKLYKSHVLSILIYGCNSWTLKADLDRRIQAFENKCYRKMLGVSYKENKAKEYVWI